LFDAAGGGEPGAEDDGWGDGAGGAGDGEHAGREDVCGIPSRIAGGSGGVVEDRGDAL